MAHETLSAIIPDGLFAESHGPLSERTFARGPLKGKKVRDCTNADLRKMQPNASAICGPHAVSLLLELNRVIKEVSHG